MNWIRIKTTTRPRAKLDPLIPGMEGNSGGTDLDNRLFPKAAPLIIRTGSPWRDIRLIREAEHGPSPVQRVSEEGRFGRIFKELRGAPVLSA